MKPLPNDEELQKIVEMAKEFEQQMKKQCELAGAIYTKYQKKIQQTQTTEEQKQKA